MIYCDTSFLLSLYVTDSHSAAAGGHLSALHEPLIWTGWHGLEFRTGLEARVGRELTSRDEANKIYDLISKHQAPSGIFENYPVAWPSAISQATKLAARYGASFKSRSLDVLHVAICVQLEVEHFWSFDSRQNELAKALGLSILESS